MKLRTQLALAFFGLAVVPLAGVTLYSYSASLDAFRRAVERESAGLTDRMGQQLELVTADLEQRVQGLEGLQFPVLPAAETAGAGPTVVDAQAFYEVLRQTMGDVAPLIRTLEVSPIAPGEPLTIHLQGIGGVKPVDSPRIIRDGSDLVFVPGHLAPDGAPGGAYLSKLATVVREASAGDGDDVLEGLAEHKLAFVVDLVDRIVEATGNSEAQAEAREQVAELRRNLAERVGQVRGGPAQPAAPAPPRGLVPRFKLHEALTFPVRRDGQTVAQVEAKIDAGEVLHSVLARTQVAADEIPFAVGSDGIVYTPNPEHMAQLDRLGVSNLGPGIGLERPVSLRENWLVVTRAVEGVDLAFGIARPVGQALEDIRRTAGRNMGWGLGLVALAMCGILPLSGRMTRNLAALTSGATRLAGGDLEARVTVSSRDEFGQLAGAFNRMGEGLQRRQGELVQQERLRKELELCRQIQDELLPDGRASFPFAEVRAVALPAREVGGDFYNYFALPGGDLALLVGDVSGKGLPAALLMANLQATLHARLPLERDLAVLARAIDEELEGSTPAEMYVTLFMGVLEPRRQRLRYVNAGHNAPCVVHSRGGIERLGPTGRPLGLISGGAFSEGSVRLERGDLLFLFTDGLVEVEDRDGQAFGEGRLERLLLASATREPDALIAEVEQAVLSHGSGSAAADDATMLLLRVEGLERV